MCYKNYGRERNSNKNFYKKYKSISSRTTIKIEIEDREGTIVRQGQ